MNLYWKKITSVLLSALLALSLVACSGGADSAETANTDTNGNAATESATLADGEKST